MKRKDQIANVLSELFQVINGILAELPENEYEDVKAELDDILDDRLYTPPEHQVELWVRLCKILGTRLPNPYISGSEWARKIGKIIRAEEKGFREGEC